ncbi:hypothetical protein DXC92_18490 [Clostridiales bacterium TF09-2AC]|nr:hypothetical protein DXC92_18490 [Clostridiales bacterium TF09-2AC]
MYGKLKDKLPEELKKSDEVELLKEYEWAKEHIPDDVILASDSHEFEKIWNRIQEEGTIMALERCLS